MRNEPQSSQQQLAPDMGKRGKNAPADRSKPAARKMDRDAQREQTEQGAGQAHEKTGRQQLAEKNSASEDAKHAHPRCHAPAVTRQNDERDDVRQPWLDTWQGEWNGRIDQGQTDRRRREASDAMVLWSGGESSN